LDTGSVVYFNQKLNKEYNDRLEEEKKRQNEVEEEEQARRKNVLNDIKL
jgi:hypothetical protein